MYQGFCLHCRPPHSGSAGQRRHSRRHALAHERAEEMMAEIKAREGSMIEITGLMRKSQYKPDGVRIGGVRISPGRAPSDGSLAGNPGVSQMLIDVEGWRPL